DLLLPFPHPGAAGESSKPPNSVVDRFRFPGLAPEVTDFLEVFRGKWGEAISLPPLDLAGATWANGLPVVRQSVPPGKGGPGLRGGNSAGEGLDNVLDSRSHQARFFSGGRGTGTRKAISPLQASRSVSFQARAL